MTKSELISDIELQLLQGTTSDDSELEFDQIALWIDYHLNDLIRREIIEEKKKGNPIPPIYIVRETALALTEETTTDIDDVDQRLYVTLTGEVLDLPRDMGVVRVLDYDLNLIQKTTVEDLEVIRDLRFAKPSTDNVLHYRQGEKVFIIGFNTADVDFNPIIVDYVKKQDLITMADTDEVLISDQLVPLLIDLCVQRGKQELYGTTPDEDNQGTDTKKTAYHTQIANPAKNETVQ